MSCRSEYVPAIFFPGRLDMSEVARLVSVFGVFRNSFCTLDPSSNWSPLIWFLPRTTIRLPLETEPIRVFKIEVLVHVVQSSVHDVAWIVSVSIARSDDVTDFMGQCGSQLSIRHK